MREPSWINGNMGVVLCLGLNIFGRYVSLWFCVAMQMQCAQSSIDFVDDVRL